MAPDTMQNRRQDKKAMAEDWRRDELGHESLSARSCLFLEFPGAEVRRRRAESSARAKHLSYRGIIQVHVTQGAWLRAQGSIKERGFGIRDPVLHSLPAVFLASSSSTASFYSLRSVFHDAHNPDVTAAEMQFRHSMREDAAWRPDGASRTCAPHTHTHCTP